MASLTRKECYSSHSGCDEQQNETETCSESVNPFISLSGTFDWSKPAAESLSGIRFLSFCDETGSNSYLVRPELTFYRS